MLLQPLDNLQEILLHILFLITRMDSIGGAQIHVRDLAAHYVRLGHRVTVLMGGKNEGPLGPSLREAGVKAILLKHLLRPIHPVKDTLAVWEVVRSLRSERPDLVTCHSSKAGLLGRIAARLVGIPVIFTAHGWSFSEGVSSCKRGLYCFIEKMAAGLAHRIITVSRYDYTLAQRYGIGTSDTMVCIHNGMPSLPADMPLAQPDKEPVRICMVARFDHPKDHLLVMRSLAILADHNWLLDLAGDGPLYEEVQTTCRRLGLEKRVTFRGYCEDVASLLQASQVFLLISNWEGLPCSILEAMRAGLPVIASDVGGVPELVQDTRTGFLIPRGDGSILTQRLQQLLVNPRLRETMGRNGRTRFDKEFSFTQMAEKTLAVYEECISF